MKLVPVFVPLGFAEVADNWSCCRVCGEHRAPEDFMGELYCAKCAGLSAADRGNLQNTIRVQRRTPQFMEVLEKISGIERAQEFSDKSISVQEMLTALAALPVGARLVVTQDGYYADSNLAKVHAPELTRSFSGVSYYAIGHSHQNYE